MSDARPERDCICVPRQLGDGHTPECHAAFVEKVWIAVAGTTPLICDGPSNCQGDCSACDAAEAEQASWRGNPS